MTRQPGSRPVWQQVAFRASLLPLYVLSMGPTAVVAKGPLAFVWGLVYCPVVWAAKVLGCESLLISYLSLWVPIGT